MSGMRGVALRAAAAAEGVRLLLLFRAVVSTPFLAVLAGFLRLRTAVLSSARGTFYLLEELSGTSIGTVRDPTKRCKLYV